MKYAPVPDLQDIDLRLLRIYLSVCRNGGFTAAQTELNIGQSTISGCIAKLESRLGMTLCQRGRGGFRLTAEGEQIRTAAQDLFDSLDAFRDRVGDARKVPMGRMSFGTVDAVVDLGGDVVPRIFRRFVSTMPGLHLQLKLGQPHELVADLLAEKLDAAFLPVFREPAGLEMIAVDWQDPQQLYCGETHPFFRRCADPARAPDVDEIRAEAFVDRAHMEGWSPYSGRGFRGEATTTDVECQLILILSGHYIGYLPERYAADWVRRGRLRRLHAPTLEYRTRMTLLVRSGDTSPAVQRFVEATHHVVAARRAS